MDRLVLCMFDDDKERLRRLKDMHINYQVWPTVRYCVVVSGLRHQLIIDYRCTWTPGGWICDGDGHLAVSRVPLLLSPLSVPSPPSDGPPRPLSTARSPATDGHTCPRPSCLFALQMHSIRRRRRRPEDRVAVELIADIRVSIARQHRCTLKFLQRYRSARYIATVCAACRVETPGGQ